MATSIGSGGAYVTLARLGRHVGVSVEYDDRTPFGSPVTTRPASSTRRIYEPVISHFGEHGDRDLVAAAPGLLEGVVTGQRFREIAEPTPDGDAMGRPGGSRR
jgi:hypothetical protein